MKKRNNNQNPKKEIILLNRYLLKKTIGNGGFGQIWLAHDKDLDIPVAIKDYLLQPDMNEKDLLRETRISAKFSNLDAVVAAKHYFIENKHFYIISDYVNGTNIKEYIRKYGCMKGGELLERMRPIIESIGKIHAQGILHRDISADNLMITNDKRIKLIDFGTARSMEEYIDKTYTQSYKYGYTPIEQFVESGEYGTQGPWTDIYSLCATIYYMITGKIPEISTTRILSDSVYPLSKIPDTGLDIHQAECIMKGLAIEPEDRYQSIPELYRDLYETEWREELIEEIEIENKEDDKKDKENIRKSDNQKMIYGFLILCIILVTFASIFYIEFKKQNNLPVATPDSSAGITTPAAVSETLVPKETPTAVQSTPVPQKTYIIGNYEGLTKKSAAKKAEKLVKKGLKITYKEKYSEKVTKGKIISQKPVAGKKYTDLKKVKLMLVVSKGRKLVSAPTPKRTSTPTAVPAKKPVSNKKDNIDFSGNLDDIPE